LFAYQLAMVLGYSSGESLLADLSVAEFRTWQAVWALHPFGVQVERLMQAQQLALYANAHRDPKQRPFKPEDFLPSGVPKTAEVDLSEVVAVLKNCRKTNG